MKNILQYIKEKISIIYRILLFVITIVLIVYLFPKEGKFRYEYQKGSPWLHEDLIAPYDFPVHKLETEIREEEDSIAREFKSYYRYDEQVFLEQTDLFASNFNQKWNKAASLRDSLKKENPSDPLNNIEFTPNEREKYLTFITSLFEFIYSKGIIEFTEDLDLTDEKAGGIVVVRNKIAEERSYNEVFTPKAAYEYLMEKITERFRNEQLEEMDRQGQQINYQDNPKYLLIRRMDLNQYIQPNLFYDEQTSQQVRQNMLNNISLTRGMVQAGEKIILKGEVVNTKTYRILESLRREYETKLGSGNTYNIIFFGQLLLVFILILILFIFLYDYSPDIIREPGKLSFVLIMLLLMILTGSLVIKYNVSLLYLVPFTVLPIVLRTFYQSRLAFMVHAVAVLIIGFIAPNGFEFVLMQFVAGIVAIFSLTNSYRRGRLFATAGLIILSYSVTYFSIAIIQEGQISKIDWLNFAWFAGSGLLLLSSYPLIYIFEKVFGFLSDLTLIELSDLNQPLLRKLAERAPGTFQHSMQVANLAEAVIFEIGGNPLLVRTGALYHDIGKMEQPFYFTENQTQGVSPHDRLEYNESAKIIINHVYNGIEIAHKHQLPEQIIDFIRTHHGTSKVLYFYRSYKNKYPDKEIDETEFTYPGPKPYSKETAVLMMADSVEAASRSLKAVTKEKINNLIENIIDFQVKENQFDNAPITFKHITIIKKIFKEKLQNIYHARIEYPDEEKPKENVAEENEAKPIKH